MENDSAIVFNIQKYSIHDGPGIRTTVFFKGCPLSCKWCHNPESLSSEIQIVRNESNCTMCSSCIIACPTKALSARENNIEYDKSRCITCGSCEDVCYHNAIKIAGKEMNIKEVLNEILKDRVFYEESGGGVTFSGGEPLAQIDFLTILAKKCKENGIHTTLDTSGFTKWEKFRVLLEHIDLVLYDLKLVDNDKHLEYCGVSNTLIIENLRKLKDVAVDIYLRLPIIKGINDSLEDGKMILEIISDIGNIKQINLLEYHKIGVDKYPRLGKKYELTGDEKPTKESIGALEQMFKNKGYKVVIGG